MIMECLGKLGLRISGNCWSVRPSGGEDDQPEKVPFVITTDGMENASKDYPYDKVRSMIEYKKAHLGWEFLFLGANIDAVETARRIGISADRSAHHHFDIGGTTLNHEVLNAAVSNLRAEDTINES